MVVLCITVPVTTQQICNFSGTRNKQQGDRQIIYQDENSYSGKQQ
jgi:hypothetical protein